MALLLLDDFSSQYVLSLLGCSKPIGRQFCVAMFYIQARPP